MPGSRKRKTGRTSNSAIASELRVIPLGGLGEIGKNITALEYGDDIIVIDCGLKFPEEEMLGIDFVIPDASYLIENKSRIRGLFLTHGHEDHIGAIPLILPQLNVPVYGTALTLGLVENKVLDARIGYKPQYREIKHSDKIRAGVFEVGFIEVCHSIPDSLAIYVRTPLGIVVHTGDFKIDASPIGGRGTDFASFAELGKEGVLLMMSDSTNSEREGFTASERTVGRTFEELFRLHKDRRIVIATFASNLHRAQQVFRVAARFNRKVALMGRSMIANVHLARKLGYIEFSDEQLVDPQEVETLAPNRTVVLTTGSQGEPFSGLVLMSKGEHRQIHLGQRDLVIVSATPIPGNEKLVSNTVNRLFACGCEVVYERGKSIHVSGHASREELKIMLGLVKPKYFMPVHGEYRHLVRHEQIAQETGVNAKNTFILSNGDVLSLKKDGKAAIAGHVQAGAVLVDGMMLGGFEGGLLRERRELSENGLMVLSVVLDDNGELAAPIGIESRGSIFGRAGDELRPDIEQAVMKALATVRKTTMDDKTLQTEIRKGIREILSRYSRTSYPGIVPLISHLGDDIPAIDAKPLPQRRRKRK